MTNLITERGVIAIGSPENKNITKFLVQFANVIAKEEKVLYLDWIHYKEYLEDIIIASGNRFSDNLDLNSSAENFELSTFIELFESIESNNYTTVFIDNINYCVPFGCDVFQVKHNNDTVIKALNFISLKLNVRIIFSVILNEKTINYSLHQNLADFSWSRLLRESCSQIISISSLEGYEDVEGNIASKKENYIFKYNTFSAEILKNKKESNIKNYIINFNNLEYEAH